MSKLPETATSLSRYLRTQKRVVTRLANSTPYALSGTSVVAPGLTKVDERLVAGTPGGSRVELDSAGLRKYATDGTTVQVDLTGEVAAFSGLITGSEIIGGALRTASSGARIEIVPVEGFPGGTIRFYSGSANETWPAEMQAFASGVDGGIVTLESPGITGGSSARLDLTSAAQSEAGLVADDVYIDASGVDTNVATLETSSGGAGGPYLTRRIFVVANITERTALIADYIAAPRSRVIDATHPLFIWKADEAAGSQLQYTVDGTTFVTIGGGGPLFADPNADRIVFWDDSTSSFAPLVPRVGLSISGAFLDASRASTTQEGIVELADAAETVTGTDWLRATTPAGVKAAIYAVGASTGVSYSAGWADYGGGNSPATWYKDKDGFIRLGGLLKRTGATITNTSSGVIFTLPVGARPAGNETFIMNKDSSAPVFCMVQTDGTVQVYGASTWTSGSSFMYLGGCQFRAA